MEKLSHIVVVLIAFLAALAAFTALQINGSDGTEALRDILLTLAGVLGGVAIPKAVS